MNKANDEQYINNLLKEWSNGCKNAENKLMEFLYPQIHKIAHIQLKSNRMNSLQTTEVVSEAFLKLYNQKSVAWQNQSHFLAITAKVIRRFLIDQFRSENFQKRGGNLAILTLEKFESLLEDSNNLDTDWLTIHQLINQLQNIDPNAALVLEYKIFGGLTYSEMAEVMSVSESTVLRKWSFAKSWIILHLN